MKKADGRGRKRCSSIAYGLGRRTDEHEHYQEYRLTYTGCIFLFSCNTIGLRHRISANLHCCGVFPIID